MEDQPSLDFETVSTLGIHPFFSNAILSGFCTYVDFERLSIDQIADIHEIASVKNENDRRADAYYQKKAEDDARRKNPKSAKGY